MGCSAPASSWTARRSPTSPSTTRRRSRSSCRRPRTRSPPELGRVPETWRRVPVARERPSRIPRRQRLGPGERVITSIRNERVAAALRLKKRAFRERERCFLVEGAQAIGEALSGQPGLNRLYHSDPDHPLVERARRSGVELVHVNETIVERLTSAVTPQALVGIAPFVDLELASIGGPG